MKNTFLISLLALSLATAARAATSDDCGESSSAEAARPAAASASTRNVKALLNSPRLPVGSSRMEVLRALGRPQFEATPEVWVYDGYHVENPTAGQEKLTHLVVRFAGRRVVRTELASPEYVADLRQPQVDPHRALVLK